MYKVVYNRLIGIPRDSQSYFALWRILSSYYVANIGSISVLCNKIKIFSNVKVSFLNK